MVHQKTVLVLVALACALGGGVNAVADFNRNINANSDGGDMASPWFYHGLEGPNFTTVSDAAKYSIRSYPKSFWTATTVTGKSMDDAGSEAFMRLFRYISGNNESKQKIEMTVPVLASVIPGQGPFCEENFTYHFYLPAEFQTNPPKVRPVPSFPSSLPSVNEPPLPPPLRPALALALANASRWDRLLTDRNFLSLLFSRQKPDDPRVTNVVLDAMDVAVMSFPGWMNEKEAISHGRDLFEDLKEDNVAFNPDMFYTAGYDSPFRLTDRHNEVWAKIQGSASDATTFQILSDGGD